VRAWIDKPLATRPIVPRLVRIRPGLSRLSPTALQFVLYPVAFMLEPALVGLVATQFMTQFPFGMKRMLLTFQLIQTFVLTFQMPQVFLRALQGATVVIPGGATDVIAFPPGRFRQGLVCRR